MMDKIKLIPQFNEVLYFIRKARSRVLSVANSELVELYWQIGRYVSLRLAAAEWGKKSVEQLAKYLQIQEPGIKGFERRNLYRMRQFYETYPDFQIVSPAVTQLSWSNNLIILSRCKTEEERSFYLKLAAKERYSKRELERQISSGVFERTMLADVKLSMIKQGLPDTASSVFKDSYVFDFLNLAPVHSEKDLQKALLASLKDFILELGRDFTFIGQEYRLQVGNSDFFVDLLFYHRELQCLVCFELKTDKFKPEYLGQLEFYLEALDRDIKKEHENHTIGVLLCRDKDDEVVEYALSRSLSPSIVAEYVTKLIPREVLRKKLNEFYDLLENRGNEE
jgi:predicted nuclease of restriction endonuclease-like (RecB) superfamily